MFVAHEIRVDVSLAVARERLMAMAKGDDLSGVSQGAYLSELERMMRVGPWGDVPGLSRLVRVHALHPVYRDDSMSLGLRWEASGMTGGLFPVLDANITLTAEDEDATRLALAGSYRPPLGRLGERLDRMVLHQVATATIRCLLRDIAETLDGSRVAKARTGGTDGQLPTT